MSSVRIREAFRNGTHCPHCGTDCISIRSEPVTNLYREVTYKCRNPDCEFIFVASIAPVRTLLPSRTPNPEVHIPGGGVAAG